jgi:hypothetical protein
VTKFALDGALQKHALLQQLFEVYGRASKAVKQVCSFQVP